MRGMEIRPVRYDHPDALALDALVQQEYVRRYGDPDLTALDPEMFVPPHGIYLLAYEDEDADENGDRDGDGRPVATGGWRRHEDLAAGYAVGDAEIKRMFVVPQARGRGLARRILAALEADARAAGRTRMVLETGSEQPEAIALYASSGYRMLEPGEKFGHYRDYEQSRCMVKPLTTETARP